MIRYSFFGVLWTRSNIEIAAECDQYILYIFHHWDIQTTCNLACYPQSPTIQTNVHILSVNFSTKQISEYFIEIEIPS